MTDELLDVKDIEAILGLGHTKTTELIAKGEIQSFKIGRRRKATQEALQEFIDRKIEEQTKKGGNCKTRPDAASER